MKIEKNCRLCLRLLTSNEKVYLIDENVRQILDALLLNLSLQVTKDPIFCNECAASLQNYSHLKLSYVNIDDLPCSSNADGQEICRFCLKRAQTECLDLYETKDNLFILEILSKHIPEWNLYVSQKLLTCETCLVLLKSIHDFILKCLDVEDRIKKYIELEGTDDSGHIELNYVLEFKPNLQQEATCDNWGEDAGSSCRTLDGNKSGIQIEQFIKIENVEVKNEESDIDETQSDSNRTVLHKMSPKRSLLGSGQVLHSQTKEVIANVLDFMKKEANDGLSIPLCNFKQRLLKATGISDRSYRKITEEQKAGMSFSSPPRKKRKMNSPESYLENDDQIQSIRKTIYEYYIIEKRMPSLKGILSKLQATGNFTGSATTLWKLLKKMGYEWKKSSDNRLVLIESPTLK